MIERLLITSIYYFSRVLILALIARAALSWFAQGSQNMYQLYSLFVRFTEPIVMPFRRLLMRFNTGMFDFSLVFAIIAIQIIARLLMTIVAVVL